MVTILVIAGCYVIAVLFFIALAVVAKRGDRVLEEQLRRHVEWPPLHEERPAPARRRSPARRFSRPQVRAGRPRARSR